MCHDASNQGGADNGAEDEAAPVSNVMVRLHVSLPALHRLETAAAEQPVLKLASGVAEAFKVEVDNDDDAASWLLSPSRDAPVVVGGWVGGWLAGRLAGGLLPCFAMPPPPPAQHE